ncbi:hypothetical protein ACQW5G_05480 [Fructilactobacillus sp. Tb1]|uniref:hypothetical protein n=1 Tax=Fructilactobacillus sp. Tb1 TaxID=3422304 RepID=UPI003D274C56
MSKTNKILIGIVVAFLVIIGCGTAGFIKANQHKNVKNNVKSQTEKTSKAKPVTGNNVLKNNVGNSSSKANNDSNFNSEKWTVQSAKNFLQKVNDTSSDGAKAVSEANVDYVASNDLYGFPGNSIFLFQENKSGVGDGGVVLTKNNGNTVTMVEGSGAETMPAVKVVIDSKTFKVMSSSDIVNGPDTIYHYFGLKNPGENSKSNDNDSDSKSSSDDNSSDKNSDSNDDKSNSDDKSSDKSDSNDDKSDSNKDKSSDDDNSDSNNDSQNSDTNNNNDDSDNN